jgi:hypothetical protein
MPLLRLSPSPLEEAVGQIRGTGPAHGGVEVALRWAARQCEWQPLVCESLAANNRALLLVPVRRILKLSRLAFSAIGRYDCIGVGLPLTCAPAPLLAAVVATLPQDGRRGRTLASLVGKKKEPAARDYMLLLAPARSRLGTKRETHEVAV